MLIVSAHPDWRRDQHLTHRWLVRDESELPEQARPCEALALTDVVFEMSTTGEQGFGASVIARCRTADRIAPREQPQGRVLHFDACRFANERGQSIYRCPLAYLLGDGLMRYVS